MPFNNRKTKTGQNTPKDAADKSWCIEHYCFLYDKSVMTKVDYASNFSDNLFGIKYKSDSINK